MSQPLTPVIPRLLATDAEVGPWIERVRAAVQLEGNALRGEGLTIEARSLRDNQWRPILLSNGGNEFASEADRDSVLVQIFSTPEAGREPAEPTSLHGQENQTGKGSLELPRAHPFL